MKGENEKTTEKTNTDQEKKEKEIKSARRKLSLLFILTGCALFISLEFALWQGRTNSQNNTVCQSACCCTCSSERQNK